MQSSETETPPATAQANERLRLLIALLAITVISFALRASTVSWHGLFGDESQCVNIARAPSLTQMFIWLRDDSNTPLLYFLLRGWMAIFGSGEFSVKLVAILISTALAPIAYAIFHRRLGRSRTWQFCLLLCLCPTLIRFGDLLRNYGLLSIVALVGTFLLMQLLENPGSKAKIVSYGVTLAAMIYTHLWGLAMVIGHILAMTVGTLIRCWSKRQFLSWLLAAILALLLFAPWIPVIVYQIQQHENVWAYQIYTIVQMILMWPVELVCNVGPIKSEMLGEDAMYTWIFCQAFFWTSLFLPAQKDVREQLNPLLWKLVLLGALVGGMLLVQAGYPLRPNYLIEFTPILLLLYVLAFDTVFKPLPKALKFILPIALWIPFWTPQLIGLPKVPEASFAFIAPKVANSINIEKDLVVVSPEEFTSQVIRYLPNEVKSTAFPDGDRLEVMKWAGIDTRIRDQALIDQVYPKMEKILKNGGAIWFFHTGIPNKVYPEEITPHPIFAWLQIHRSREVRDWLRDHAVQDGSMQEFAGREFRACLEVYRPKTGKDSQ